MQELIARMKALSRVHEGVLRLDEPCTIEARLQEGWIAAPINT